MASSTQNRDLQESDYLSVKPEGDEIIFQDRRFILGQRTERAF